MKAIVQNAYGSPDMMELKEIDEPVVAGNQVLVGVRAASVNAPDVASLTGVPYIARIAFGLHKPRSGVPGSDVAGTVEAVGKDVMRFHVGEEVFGSGWGTFAEYAVAAEKNLMPKPPNITFEQAAAAPVAGLVALQALRSYANLQPGQKVLINGAGGGIGTFAIQIGKSLGAEVTGVCSPSKVDLVRSIGADKVVDYTREDFTHGNERYDLILDNVSEHSLSRLRRTLTRHGTLVPNGGRFDRRWLANAPVLLVAAPLMSLFVPEGIRTIQLAPNHSDWQALEHLLRSGRVTPFIGSTFRLTQAREAVSYYAQGHARGKVVITM
jgi:NADPH:quinone reductase-like Zn-dependent oxidoreductase